MADDKISITQMASLAAISRLESKFDEDHSLSTVLCNSIRNLSWVISVI